ncbi:Uncharacterised protein [Salmonella enterica subsp. enterica serovar Bovismorbificans]|uniref:Uncharacterized protein n=1 Tax=Salmonella enterica subsp. enterica serovar Bovismorbificans TaxID=58097 RepID=A0A655D7Y9_SALET|nr:Uncharacterised protein [Salmonella enterica subsp. enterica serovar Bovismorbificans]
MRLIKGLGVAQIKLRDLQIMLMIQPRYFVKHLNIYAFIRLQANRQFVLRQVLPGLFKEIQFRRLEINHDFRALGWQTLAGAQIEWHARPTPVIDVDADRDESFGVAAFIRALFFQIARHLLTLRKARGVLTTNRFFTHVGAINTAQRFQHFDFFIANTVGAQVRRR